MFGISVESKERAPIFRRCGFLFFYEKTLFVGDGRKRMRARSSTGALSS